MESKDEIMTFYGRCKCCLEYGYMKNMWKEQVWEDEREIYGEMLMDTFNIVWQCNTTEESICESCIGRLRDAYHFKKEVISSQQMLDEGVAKDELAMDYKNDMMELYLEETSQRTDDVEQGEEEEPAELKTEYEIEYLEEDADIVEKSVKPQLDQDVDSDSASGKQQTNYRNYTQADLKKCLDMIQRGMSQADAARIFNIPKKTLNVKISSLKKKSETPAREKTQEYRERAEKSLKLIEETQTILEMTNTVPFKVKAARLYCAYCYLKGGHFEDADELRSHTFEHHETERIVAIDSILRPFCLNEILRIDIHNLSCAVCKIRLPGWNEMFQHMYDEHGKQFDQAYTRLIPYELSHDLRCALCDERHTNIHYLESHMNAHYNNQVCPECGDTFVSVSRLKRHMEIHSTGSYPCEYCEKVFTLKKYRVKHIAMMHKLAKTLKCFYCTERFFTEHLKNLHIRKCHKDKIKIITCEICGKMFDWRPNYLSHLKKAHTKVQRYQCKFCLK
ncbi:zinc finger protein 28 isoform X3 [Amyelois transitella]|uniref:zinc finger protein 28 isoform X3 n=1 Tax=Amyelois transitella TaxID=680683 RepID=UPI0029901D16|nr:zinc finger protein 28 isoform X3 [Amyelois transitella]